MIGNPIDNDNARTANSAYKKMAAQWLNEVQFFNQTFGQVCSFVLRNSALRIAETVIGNHARDIMQLIKLKA